MRLEWLEDILAVAANGSFQAAAEKRHMTQSAFSRRIQSIEEYIGVELFDRGKKPVQLRPATANQKDRIARLASELRQLVVELQRGERMAENRVVIASQHALTTALAPSILHGIQTRNEATYVRLRSANLDECFALLLSRQADLVLAYRLPGVDHLISAEFVQTVAIGEDRLIPVFASHAVEDPGGGFKDGTIPFIAYPDEVFLGQIMRDHILPGVRSVARPVAQAETALTLAALEMAAVGVAVAWVPQSMARQRIAEGSLVDLSASLPSHALEVTAVRLYGKASPALNTIWTRIVGAAGQASPDASSRKS